jgi:hypothetical protein
MVVLVVAAVLGIQPFASTTGAQTTTPPRLLFLRGTLDSVGADGIDNNQLSDIADLVTNAKAGKGYGVWTQLLLDQGYEVSQLEEGGNREAALPVNLARANLKQYAAVVFGSNNSGYSADDIKAVTDYVAGGGGVLFMADRNWGPKSGAASASDSLFLKQWGITMQQDNGQTETHTQADFKQPDHPILQSVLGFSSFGVSACSIGTVPSGAGLKAPPTVLVPFTSSVQLNTEVGKDGPQQPADPTRDGALVIAEPGNGRVACLYDRDMFFNFTINDPKQSQATLGVNLINWLATGS